MDSEEYWRLFRLVKGDVEAAIGCSSTYLTINRLAAADPKVWQKYNGHADFWRSTAYGLQTGFFMAFGRVFDDSKTAFNIEKLVHETIEHPGFFSKAEFRKRMRDVWKVYGDQPDPDLLAKRVAEAWEPTRKELEVLRTELAPYPKKFRAVYEPIRDEYFAHRSKTNESGIEELFSKAMIDDAAEILRFVYGLVCGIEQMAINATPPGQWYGKDYDKLYRIYETSAETFVRGL